MTTLLADVTANILSAVIVDTGMAPWIAATLLVWMSAARARERRRAWQFRSARLDFDDLRQMPDGGDMRPDKQKSWPHGTLLHRLPPAPRRELLRLGVQRQVPTGQILIHEGVRESHVIVLEEGLTKVSASLPDGRSALLAIRVGGDLIGEMSALNNEPRSATVTACGPTRYSVIRLDRFRSFLASNPAAAVDLAAMVADRLRWSNHRRIDVTSYKVKVRAARVIAELARCHGQRRRNGVVVDVRLTQPELATICGAAETSIQKALRDLRTEGLVETDYRRITVRDLTKLRRTGRLEPTE